jgi:hypothetical protein
LSLRDDKQGIIITNSHFEGGGRRSFFNSPFEGGAPEGWGLLRLINVPILIPTVIQRSKSLPAIAVLPL